MSVKSLLEALDGRIRVVEKVSSWQEATRIAGELLLKSGCVDENYVEGMIRTCKELGPYIVIMPGLAMPHARPEEGAKKVCASLLIVKEGVNYDSPNDPVYIVLAFSSPDKSSHLDMLKSLASLLLEKGQHIVSRLRDSQSAEEAFETLIDLLKDFGASSSS